LPLGSAFAALTRSLLGAAGMTSPFSFRALVSVSLSVTALALGAGCSSSSEANSPPVIDAIDVPATATIGKSGNYEVQGTISAHDTDGMIHQIVLEIPGYTTPVLTVNKPSIDKQPFLLQIDGHSPKGPLNATGKVIDDQGASTSRTITITLQ
jgi:hypothetical protein